MKQYHLLYPFEALDLCFAFECRGSVLMRLSVYNLYDLSCSRVVSAATLFVFLEATFDICGDTRIERSVTTSENVDDILHAPYCTLLSFIN